MSLCAHQVGTVCFECFRQQRLRRLTQDEHGQGVLPLDPPLDTRLDTVVDTVVDTVPPASGAPVGATRLAWTGPSTLNERQIAHRRIMLANFKRRQVRTS